MAAIAQDWKKHAKWYWWTLISLLFFSAAAEHNFVECIHALFNNTSVLVDALNGIDEKETALHLASKHGYCDAAEALLQ